jgi:predicted enzyme related to lactoylglutathione lyase
VAYFEVSSWDEVRAQRFYADLFGWKVTADPAMGGYGLVDTVAGEAAIGGGIGPVLGAGRPGVRIYVRVEDLEECLERAQQWAARWSCPRPSSRPASAASQCSVTRAATPWDCGADQP